MIKMRSLRPQSLGPMPTASTGRCRGNGEYSLLVDAAYPYHKLMQRLITRSAGKKPRIRQFLSDRFARFV